jgi:hypothetical protein
MPMNNSGRRGGLQAPPQCLSLFRVNSAFEVHEHAGTYTNRVIQQVSFWEIVLPSRLPTSPDLYDQHENYYYPTIPNIHQG